MMPEIVARYGSERAPATQTTKLAIWKHSRKIRFMQPDEVLRVHADSPFRVHWSGDQWATINDTESTLSPLEISYADLVSFKAAPGACLVFTLYWPQGNHWEGTDYTISVA